MRSSRIVQDTTSTMSRLLAPSSFIDREGSMRSSVSSSTTSSRYFFTTARIASRLMVPPVLGPKRAASQAQLVPLVVQAHDVVAEGRAAIHHDELAADPVHQ